MSLKSLFMAASAAAILIGPAEALAQTWTLSGTVTYRERMALPSDARVTVSLADVSLADAPAQVLGETVVDPAGRQVPIPYQISYDDSALRPITAMCCRPRSPLASSFCSSTRPVMPFLLRGLTPPTLWSTASGASPPRPVRAGAGWPRISAARRAGPGRKRAGYHLG